MPTHKEAIQMVLDALTNEKQAQSEALKKLMQSDIVSYTVERNLLLLQ